MNLQPTTGRPFSTSCCVCNRRIVAGDKTHGEAVYADLSGTPWLAYYCAGCASTARAQQQLERILP